KRFGKIGLLDRSSSPARQPSATPGCLLQQIESMRREHERSASRIAFELEQAGTPVSRRTITRLLAQLGLNRRKFIDPNGETNREPQSINAKRPGHMVHLDVKKVGRIPDGGGWRVHGEGSEKAKAVARTKTRGARTGYIYLHSAIDGHTGSLTQKRYRMRGPSLPSRTSGGPEPGSLRTASPGSSAS